MEHRLVPNFMAAGYSKLVEPLINEGQVGSCGFKDPSIQSYQRTLILTQVDL